MAAWSSCVLKSPTVLDESHAERVLQTFLLALVSYLKRTNPFCRHQLPWSSVLVSDRARRTTRPEFIEVAFVGAFREGANPRMHHCDQAINDSTTRPLPPRSI